jgi:hypothetical protein
MSTAEQRIRLLTFLSLIEVKFVKLQWLLGLQETIITLVELSSPGLSPLPLRVRFLLAPVVPEIKLKAQRIMSGIRKV